MQCVADDISVFDNGVYILAWLAVDDNLPSLDSIAVVLPWPVPEFRGKDIKDLTSAPALLAECVVGEVVGRNATEAVREIIRSRPGVARRYGDGRWRRKWLLCV
jgi:hypothetical protein